MSFVFSRSPIGHQFSIIQNGIENVYVIKGTNSHQVLTGGAEVPFKTEMEESVFNAIKAKYVDHIGLFGGKDPISGRTLDAQIYLAKNESEAKKKMDDSKPVITQNEMVSKVTGISKFKDERE